MFPVIVPGSYFAQLVKSETVEPIYSRSGECLAGGTVETWDRVPAQELGPFVLGDIVQVGDYDTAIYIGDDQWNVSSIRWMS